MDQINPIIINFYLINFPTNVNILGLISTIAVTVEENQKAKINCTENFTFKFKRHTQYLRFGFFISLELLSTFNVG